MRGFMTCHFCEKEVPQGAAICPHCGKLQVAPQQRRRDNLRIAVAVGLSLAIFLGWGWLHGFASH